jgi:hypothetical protein
MDEPESPEEYLWRAAITALLERRYPAAEAFDNAQLVLSAYRRRRTEARRHPVSGENRPRQGGDES